MIKTPAINYPCGMFDVQHFVEHDVLDEPFGHIRRVKRFTNRDRFVRGIMMTEDAASATL